MIGFMDKIEQIKLECERRKQPQASFLKEPPWRRLNLNDAVTTLENISYSSNRKKLSYTKAERDNLINQKVQSAFLSFHSQPGSFNGNKNDKDRSRGINKTKKWKKSSSGGGNYNDGKSGNNYNQDK